MERTLIIMTALFLIVGIGIGYVISSSQILAIQSQLEDLSSEIGTLIDAYNALSEDYGDSLSQISELQSLVDNLDSELATITNNYTVLNENYNALNSSYMELQQQEQYELYFVGDRDYYNSIRVDLQSANESIYVAMYSMIFDPADSFDWANDLIRELVNASNRGITVNVIIENRTFFGIMSSNQEAYNYLYSNGVNVEMDNEADTDHMKFVLIDGEIVYVGSHNWSESALYRNHETTIRIVNPTMAETFKEYFEIIRT
jgi:hypothetical protein